MWSKEVWERAADCAARAAEIADEHDRPYFERLHETCTRIVRSLEFVDPLDGRKPSSGAAASGLGAELP